MFTLYILLQTAITGSGSANNLTLSKDQSPNISSNNVAPPLPPHRTCPAPPPPIRQTSIVRIILESYQLQSMDRSNLLIIIRTIY